MPLFIELGLIIFVATIVAMIMRLLRQPLIVGYILAGVIVGPYFFNVLQSTSSVEVFSKIGIAVLLFIVGLSLNPDVIKEVGKSALLTGIGQVIITSLIGFVIMRFLEFGITASLYGAIALTLSSTIIILKLLSDKGDLNKLYGKLSLGFLLVQDIIAILILLVISIWGSVESSTIGVGAVFAGLLIKGIIATILLYIISKYLLPRMAGFLAGSQELLFLFSLSWGLGLGALFYTLGFSIEIGALIAGVTLSVSPFSYEIGSRLKPLRDFFIVLFFVLLGSQLVITDINTVIIPALVLSFFVLVINPIIVMFLLNLLGYRSRTVFMASLAVSQVSEFSLILMALGLSLGQIDQYVVSLVTLVALITIAGSSYLIIYADKLYAYVGGIVGIFSLRQKFRGEYEQKDDYPEMIILGYDRVGYEFVLSAKKLGARYLVVDFNPESIDKMRKAGIPFKYGDADDVEFLDEIGIGKASMIISTIPDFKTNLLLVTHYRRLNKTGIIMVISHDIKQTHELYQHGATYVTMPHYLGAYHASGLIEKYGLDATAFIKEREAHLARLKERQEMSS